MKPLNIVLATLLLAASCLVHAHTHLTASVPADGAVLAQAPAALQLEFSGPVRLLGLRLTGANGKTIALELPTAAQPAKSVSVPLPPLPAQGYSVEWTVMGADTHRAAGTLRFEVGAAAVPAAPPAAHGGGAMHDVHEGADAHDAAAD